MDRTDDGLVLASTDRITDSNQVVESYNGACWLRSETKGYAQDNNATPVTTAIKHQRLTGHIPLVFVILQEPQDRVAMTLPHGVGAIRAGQDLLPRGKPDGLAIIGPGRGRPHACK